MLSVEPWASNSGDEELGPVGVWTSISHGEQTWGSVLELEVLVSELLSVDGFSTSAVEVGEVSSLEHELRDDSVENGSLVAESLLSSAESSEVLSGLRNDIWSKLEGDSSEQGGWGSL